MAAAAALAPLHTMPVASTVHHKELVLDLHSLTAAAELQTERESVKAQHMLIAMFPSIDIEVITTVLSWNGGNVESAASSILDMWTGDTMDGGALADEQRQTDAQTARDLQAAWDAEAQDEEQEEQDGEKWFARSVATTRTTPSTQDSSINNCDGTRGRRTSGDRMLAFLRARSTASTRITARLLDSGDDLPQKINLREPTLPAEYAEAGTPPPFRSSPAAVPVLANTRPLSTAAAPGGRYNSRVQRAKRANQARKLSSDGTAPLLALALGG